MNLKKSFLECTLGNLPARYRQRIEERLGKDRFDNDVAADSSATFNAFFTYPAAFSIAMLSKIEPYASSWDDLIPAGFIMAIGGFFIGAGEWLGREDPVHPEKSKGSIPGALVSLPYTLAEEAYNLGKTIKNRPNKWKRLADKLAMEEQ